VKYSIHSGGGCEKALLRAVVLIDGSTDKHKVRRSR
jgi:hypothetical protein